MNGSKLTKALNSINSEWLTAAFGLLLIVAALWAPFGFKNPDVADGWINANGVEYNSASKILSKVFEADAVRPLVRLPWVLAFMISKDSFTGVGLLYAGAFWGKAVVLYAILRKMQVHSRVMAFLTTVLFVLFPADQGNYLLSALSRQIAVFFYLLSVLLMLLTVRYSKPFYAVGLLLVLIIGSLISEQGYLLIILTPLLLLFYKISSSREKRRAAVLWYVGFLLPVVNFFLAPKEYQNRLFEQGATGDTFRFLKDTMLSNLVAYRRIFFDGWIVALNSIENARGWIALLALGITLIVVGAMFFLSKLDESNVKPINIPKTNFAILIVGLSIIGLGFFPYSITRYRYYDFRVYYYSAIGGALVVDWVVSTISDRFRQKSVLISLVLGGVLIFITSLYNLVQHSKYIDQSRLQQKILISIVEQAPSVKPGTTIVMVFPSSSVSDFDLAGFSGLPFRHHFGAALSWIYDQRNIRGAQCVTFSRCDRTFDYEKAIIFFYRAGGRPVLLDKMPWGFSDKDVAATYDPFKRINNFAPFPERPQIAFDIRPKLSAVTPQDWISTGQTLNDRRACDVYAQGNCSLLFFNDGLETVFSQKVNIVGDANEQLVLSFMGKSQKAIKESILLAGVTILYKDDVRDQYQVYGELYKKWTLYQLEIETNGAFTDIIIELRPNSASVPIWLDEIQLVRNAVEVVKIENPSFEK
ncbi:MAG: hypothetical protein HND47_23130 [Chloroflexi bacterium]|nr:hypothetical protein [Chloroflexota bacterium]